MSNTADIFTNDINAWLDSNNNNITLDITDGSFSQVTPTLYSSSSPNTRISIGFKNPLNKDTVDVAELRENFNFVALDRLPLHGLDIPSNWDAYPQTPMSSFDEGVTIDSYENGQLCLSITTRFFAIYGRQIQEHPIMDRALDEGTYVQVRRDIQGTIKVNLPIVIE